MKIGILTYHCQPNFGAQLQAISTVGYIKRLGHEPIVLNFYHSDLKDLYEKTVPFEQVECQNQFTESFLPVTKRLVSEDELINEIETQHLDGLIMGSDALFKYVPLKNRQGFSLKQMKFWNHNVLSCLQIKNNPFFGGYISRLKCSIPVATYAVSSQNCPYNKMTLSERVLMNESLKNIVFISVRDSWTQEMVKKITGRTDVPIYPDPVFSFNQNCYLAIPSKTEILKKFKIPDNYILLCFNNRNLDTHYVEKLAVEIIEKGYCPVLLPHPEGLCDANIRVKIELPLSPIEWYSIIINSCGYIGERMHPIVVCLHNSIPFFNFDEYGIVTYSKILKRRKLNLRASKTRLILEDANLNDNICSYLTNESLPSPTYVISKILEFDKNKCRIFSRHYQAKYENGMNNVLNYLSNV